MIHNVTVQFANYKVSSSYLFIYLFVPFFTYQNKVSKSGKGCELKIQMYILRSFVLALVDINLERCKCLHYTIRTRALICRNNMKHTIIKKHMHNMIRHICLLLLYVHYYMFIIICSYYVMFCTLGAFCSSWVRGSSCWVPKAYLHSYSNFQYGVIWDPCGRQRNLDVYNIVLCYLRWGVMCRVALGWASECILSCGGLY